MNKGLILIAFVFGISFSACNNGNGNVFNKKAKKTFTERDISITSQNSFSDLFIDSSKLEEFIMDKKIDSATAQHLRSFYNSRNYQFAWFNQSGLNESGLAFWNLLNSFISISKDSSLFDKKLARRMNEFTDGDTLFRADEKSMATTELSLTRQFFIYARTAYAGRIEPEELQWFIPKKKIDALALLDSLVAHKGKRFEEWEPLNNSYKALKNELIRFNDIAKKGGWQPITLGGKKSYKPGDSSITISQVKARLYLSGDLQEADTSAKYDTLLSAAVRKVQRRFGFNEDGIIDTGLVKALNVPVKQRVEQILINLERMRWLPEKESPSRIVANIPEFMLHVYENGTKAFEMPIVVGKESNSTVIFNDELKYIVFSPYWNVPTSIVKKEIIPAMSKNPGYLAHENMEVTGNSGGVPIIRQKPGGKNALGRVKFLFPNNYNIYFHDTPAKSLFKKEMRAFSHGCMRLADAEKMAKYLLRDQPEWTAEKIKKAMNAGKEDWVTIKTPIPVYVSYFTAWVDEQGLLNFRDDIYGHDARMAGRLFMNPATQIIDSSKLAKK
jgi:L,D-transpeptidase YcbB